MISIDREYEAIYEIQKSKFLSFSYPVFDVNTIEERLHEIRSEHKNATHVCYAYIIDEPKAERMSDDGEPGGTAGKPLLELLKKKKLSNVLLIVVRYFGGIKLGAGGLVRAYTTAGNMALNEVKLSNFVEVKKYRAIVPNELGAKFLSTLISMSAEVVSTNYAESATVDFVGGDIDKISRMYPVAEIVEIGRELKCQ